MRFKKAKTLIVAGVLALMAVVTVPATAKAEHVVPNSGGMKCNNTRYYYKENGLTNVYYSNHQLTDGRSCRMSRMRYAHDRMCTSCRVTILRGDIFECTEKHTICSKYIHSCNSN